jgi:uncharacterized iron-regulated membrane protein
MAISTLTLRRWHRRFALVLGIFFVIQGLTGAIAQHRFWLMQATNPDLYRVKSNGNPLPPGDILAALKKSKPDFQVAHMMYPAAVSPNTAILVMGGRDTNKHDMSRMVTVDQFQDQVIAEQAASSGWVGLADAIHKWLIFGTPGKVILTMLGVGVVIFSALGVVIWFRTRQTSRNAKGVVKLHRTAGIAASLFIISVAGTGTALNLYTWAEKTSGRSVFKSNMEMAAHSTMAMSPKVDANTAYAIAQKAVGNLHMSAFGPAGPQAKNYWFAFMVEAHRCPRRSAVWRGNWHLSEWFDQRRRRYSRLAVPNPQWLCCRTGRRRDLLAHRRFGKPVGDDRIYHVAAPTATQAKGSAGRGRLTLMRPALHHRRAEHSRNG